jgi:hypothetical protein
MRERDWEDLVHRYLDGIATKEETEQLSRQLEPYEGARLKYLHTADLHGILTTKEEFHEPVSNSTSSRRH